MIKYILPGFSNISRNEIIINLFENYNYLFRNNVKLHSFYGNFPNAIWNGGRLCLGENSSIKYIKKVRDFHNKHNIAIALTMTNCAINENNLNDKYCNDILNIFNNGKNEVLVTSDVLEKYIREKYKNIKINRSITATKDIAWNEKNYNLSLLPVRHINDFEYINSIPLNERKKMEILCNEPCVSNCKYKYSHYEEISNIQISKYKPVGIELYGNCKMANKSQEWEFVEKTRQAEFYVSVEDIYEKYLPLGIEHFKINGREKNHIDGYSSIVNYLIKQEYQKDVICYMLERLMLEFSKEVETQFDKYKSFLYENDALWFERF